MMNKLILVANLLINLSFYLATKVIPKKKHLWIFGAWFGTRYSDNPKAFFEYINNEQKHIHAVWICKDDGVVEQVRKLGFTAYHEKSLRGIYYQLRAQFVFVCQSLHDDIYAPCIGKKTIVVNLWHGLPLKKIMYDVFSNKVVKKNVVGRLFDRLSPYNKIRNDYLLATSKETQETLSKAFRIPKHRTLITGFPRNDILLGLPKKPSNAVFKCLYMPTFRGGVGSECDLFEQHGFDAKEIDKTLVENNVEIVLRLHPVNKPTSFILNAIEQAKNIRFDYSADIFDTLTDYDAVVTDYSGGYFDFLLTGRPILFAPFDLEKYKAQERDLYYHYEDVTLAPYSRNWPVLIDNIVATKQKDLSADYQQGYKVLKLKFHQPLPENAPCYSEILYQQLSRF